MHEATADSSAINSNIFTSTLQNLVTKIRFILNKMNKQIICSKSTGCAGTLSEDKYKSFPGDEQKSQESQLLEKTSVEIPGQESLLDEVQFLEESSEENIDPDLQLDEVRFPEEPSEEISDLDLQLDKVQLLEESPEETLYPDLQLDEVLFLKEPPEEIPGPDLQSDEVQFLEEPSEEIPGQGFKSQEIQKTGILDSDSSLEADSSSPISESVKSEKMSSESKRQETIRVRTSNLDNIMNLVGELVINKGRLLQISQEYNLPELEEATATLDKSISSLQDEVMRIRMVKIERVFSKFPRMVRDLSRKFNKNIDFEIEGQDTELDRTILDEINDPLVHLVRNAVDHGIESPEEREQAGKSEIGHIKLSARREKNNVIIEIEDDGKGMDLELLKKKALEKGLLSAFDLENLSEDEIRMLIFTPGFSTKDTATEISGRGVGMDAVKTAVEKLGGKVRVYSKKGEYTKIRIDLPPTVAIIKSLLVEVGSETYAIPISNVVKALSVDSNDYKFVKETPLLYIRDKLLPVLKLKEIFNIPCEKLDKELAIIVEKENEEVGLIVDSIIDQQEIVIKPLGNIFSDLKGFIGVTILGDGRVIPILDVSVLIRGDIDD
ncbi:chemotaxis protein CheA [Methanosarcina sp. KYL-1]|nr:chemotaxis protein CheA [Methanosarcina sp. KYL-1]